MDPWIHGAAAGAAASAATVCTYYVILGEALLPLYVAVIRISQYGPP